MIIDWSNQVVTLVGVTAVEMGSGDVFSLGDGETTPLFTLGGGSLQNPYDFYTLSEPYGLRKRTNPDD